MSIEVKVIEDSLSDSNVRLTTMQLKYPRLVHSELMTHRVFSRNASSSRAIPVAKMIEQVRENPAMPVHWGANQPGMQAKAEVADIEAAKQQWIRAANDAANNAQVMLNMGLHKQVANRILEPFQWIHVIVTATEWDNFFALRDHADADPNIQALARAMKEAMENSEAKFLPFGEWHLPYVTQDERNDSVLMNSTLVKMSAARCARVSYLTHDGLVPSLHKDLELFDRLVGSNPIHASPIEHQGTPMHRHQFPSRNYSGNFRGWTQYRKMFEQSNSLVSASKI